jgi:rhodanese-related sulfurtransferase
VRLCNPEVVNQYDVRPIYSAAMASHKLAFSKLALPSDKAYANEEYGGGFVSATALRTQGMSDITPSKIEGVDVVATQELVRRMLSDKPPILVDVLGSYDTIPQSVVLLFAGVALENAELDEVLGIRIAALLALLAPDPHAPVVFFCTGRNCWHSVNAALRAKKFGYTRVGWYRGGVESWKAAGLPTATGVVQAVAR